jgi:ribonuclease HI
MTITLRFDGLYRPLNTGTGKIRTTAGLMCYGWVILRDGIVIGRGHGGYVRSNNASSHIAEYLGLIEGLEALADMGLTNEAVVIIGDARSVIDQMRGEASVSAERIRGFYQRAKRCAARFRAITWQWSPRKTNHDADALTRRALRQIRANPESYTEILNQKHPRFTPILDLRVFQASGLSLV